MEMCIHGFTYVPAENVQTLPQLRSASTGYMQTSGFHDIHLCLSFVGWHRSCVQSWRMYAGYRCWPPSSAVCWQSNVLGQEITQPVRWLLFCHRQTMLWNSLPEQLRQPDITFGQIKW